MLATAYTGADLAFDAAPHRYLLPDGREVPSVTHILRATGISTDFDGIASTSSKLATAIDYRRALGTACHADCHAFDDDDLDWSTVDPRVEPFVRAWAVFRENSGAHPLTRERMVFHPGIYFCGTLDGIFHLPSGVNVLIDIKIGDPEDAGCRYQTAGYELAYVHEHPFERIDERWAVQLLPERRVPYATTNYTARPEAWRDGVTFQSFVTTYNAQAMRRRRSA